MRAHDLAQRLGQVDALATQLDPTLRESRHVEQVVDDARYLLELPLHDFVACSAIA